MTGVFGSVDLGRSRPERVFGGFDAGEARDGHGTHAPFFTRGGAGKPKAKARREANGISGDKEVESEERACVRLSSCIRTTRLRRHRPAMLAADDYWPGNLCTHPNHQTLLALRLRACRDDPWPAVSLVVKQLERATGPCLSSAWKWAQRSFKLVALGGCKQLPIHIIRQSTVHLGAPDGVGLPYKTSHATSWY